MIKRKPNKVLDPVFQYTMIDGGILPTDIITTGQRPDREIKNPVNRNILVDKFPQKKRENLKGIKFE